MNSRRYCCRHCYKERDSERDERKVEVGQCGEERPEEKQRLIGTVESRDVRAKTTESQKEKITMEVIKLLTM